MEELNPATWTSFWQQLLGLGVLIIGAAGFIVWQIRQHVVDLLKTQFDVWRHELESHKEELKENTEITRRVEGQTNGALVKARNEAQTYRSMYERYERLIQAINATEDGREAIDKALQSHRVAVSDQSFKDLQKRLMSDVGKDLTDAPG